jgi:hypothetical protein
MFAPVCGSREKKGVSIFAWHLRQEERRDVRSCVWQQREEGVLLFNNRGKKGKEGCAYLCIVAEGRREKGVVSFCVWHQKEEENRSMCVSVCVTLGGAQSKEVWMCLSHGRRRQEGCVYMHVAAEHGKKR